MKLQKLDLASCCRARKRHCFYFVITLRPANDSLTRVNVKFVLLRWLNLWSVLLDGMYAPWWHLQQSKLFTIELKLQRWLKNPSVAEKNNDHDIDSWTMTHCGPQQQFRVKIKHGGNCHDSPWHSLRTGSQAVQN